MNILTWISNMISGKPDKNITLNELNVAAENYAGIYNDIYIRELAFWSAVNLIAAAVSKCEFRTYKNGKEIKEREYYLWNVEPNINQNRQEFLRELIAKLYRHNEALVIEHENNLLVADGYSIDQYALYDDIFRGVSVKNFEFNRSFRQSEVLHLKLHSTDMCQIINEIYARYEKMLAYSINAYQKSRGTKGIFKYEAFPVAGTDDRKVFDSLVNEKIQKWLVGDNAALPLGKGQEWKDIDHKTYNNESTRDIRAQIDDICDFTAKGFGIPSTLLRGDIAGIDDALKLWQSTCIEPLAMLLETEINRKRYGYDGFSKGNKIDIYTNNLEHHEILNSSVAIDKLISSGVYSPNDIRRACGEPPIDMPYADNYYITKNYSPADGQTSAGENTEG